MPKVCNIVGGVISPLLANIALHGMEKAITEGMKYREIKPILVRYADDFVILHTDKEELERATRKITEWLKHMGLVLNPKKTRVTHRNLATDGLHIPAVTLTDAHHSPL